MTDANSSLATLRVFGDDLVPAEITSLLGCPPTESHTKGEIFRGKKTGRKTVMKTGMWRLAANDSKPENLEGQVKEILSKLTKDLAIWSSLKQRFNIDLLCGFFMQKTNEGLVLTSETLRSLGERGIELRLDVYAPIEEIGAKDVCPCGSGKTYGQCCQ